RVTQFSSIGFMITAIAGSLIASVNIAWPWIFGAAGYAACAFLGGLLHERAGAPARLALARVPRDGARRSRGGRRRGLALLSFRSTLATAGASMGLLVGGYVVDVRSIPFQWQMGGVLALLAAPCYLALRPRR